ncbi:MAG: hydroxyacid dehydrogenase [Selenomonadaceae bacterium]|nr:hydroxyacid dehydrogenase [Selenomonadaceae bacterium]
MAKVLKSELFKKIPRVDEKFFRAELKAALKNFGRKIIVLDDDPTGVQTVNGISVYTDWAAESIAAGFAEENSMFFILTNSRAFSAEKTRAEHKKIAERICAAGKNFGKDFIIISRSDSTLRGHYPLETQTLRETLEACGKKIDGEILMPFFKEGGRFTVGDVHYVQEENFLVPAAETEFARDKTFGYTSSNLAAYVEEKTRGAFKKESVTCISLEELRGGDAEKISARLENVRGFNKVIVNAADYVDVEIFTLALLRSRKNFLFRTAAAFPKVIGGVEDKNFLTRSELVDANNPNGGLIIVGSHVKKTTDQLAALKKIPSVEFIEFDVSDLGAVDEIIRRAEENISRGRTTTIYTSRRVLDLGDAEKNLAASVKISDALTSIVKRLNVRPKFLIAKGGITSADVGTKGLGVKKALVLGQVAAGVPVWKIGAESKFPGMSYIIFPGNVGNVDTLREIVETLGS